MASSIAATQRALGSTAGYAVFGSVLAVWLDLRLGDDLEPVISNATERRAVTDAIVDQANPSARAAGLAPGLGLDLPVRPKVREQVVFAADSVSATGIQVAMLLGAAALAVMFVIARRVVR